ncbi:hypothetical protein BVRB_021890, partial [Beta vulgaris subsp. vulgaris]
MVMTTSAMVPIATDCPPNQASIYTQNQQQQTAPDQNPGAYTPMVQPTYNYMTVPSSPTSPSQSGWGAPQPQPMISMIMTPPQPQTPAPFPGGEPMMEIGKQVHQFVLESGAQGTSMTVANGIVIPGSAQAGTKSSIVMLPNSLLPLPTRSTPSPTTSSPTTSPVPLKTPSVTSSPPTSPTPSKTPLLTPSPPTLPINNAQSETPSTIGPTTSPIERTRTIPSSSSSVLNNTNTSLVNTSNGSIVATQPGSSATNATVFQLAGWLMN